VLEKITVLSTGQQKETGDGRDAQVVPVVNVLVTPEQAELLTLATREGMIQLILRNPVDDEETADDRLAVHASDLYTKARRKRTPRPRPRVVVRTEPAPAPPPTHQVEMIRGNQRTVETLAASTP
jgi:pilus assembly protein CpaB